MEEKDINKQVESVQSKITTLLEMDKVADMISNNTIEFEYKEVKFRASKPTYKQKQEANEKRIVKLTELLKDEKYLMEDTLIEMYKKKGIDIKEMDNKLNVLDKQKQDFMYKLGEAIKEQRPNDELTAYRTEIQKITLEQQGLMLRRSVLMDSSLESQINVFVFSYLTFLCVEKKEGENWIKAWNTYDDFMNSEESLINLAVFYESFLTRVEL